MPRSHIGEGNAAEPHVPAVAWARPESSPPDVPPALTQPAVVPPPVAPPAAVRPPVGGRAGSRLSAAWVGIWIVALVSIALIVFMLQNTRSVQVSFVGLHGTLPLAMALLIAMVGGIVLTLVFGTARITQLRRLARRSRTAQNPARPGVRRGQAGRP